MSASLHICSSSHTYLLNVSCLPGPVLDVKRTMRKDGLTLPPNKQLSSGFKSCPRHPPIALLPATHQLGTWHHFLVLTSFQVSMSPQLDASMDFLHALPCTACLPPSRTTQSSPSPMVWRVRCIRKKSMQVHRKAGVVKGTNSAMMGSGPAGSDGVSEEPLPLPSPRSHKVGVVSYRTVLFIEKNERSIHSC